MPKDVRNIELEELENLLSNVVSGGDSADGAPHAGIPDEEFWSVLRERDRVRGLLQRAQDLVGTDKMVFPDLIAALRQKAGVSLEEVAREVGLVAPAEFAAIEQGTVRVLQLPAEKLVSIMEAFALGLSVVERSLRRLIARDTTTDEMSAPSPRSSGRLENRMLNDLANFLVDRDEVKAELPPGLLQELRRLLEQRGRSDLL